MEPTMIPAIAPPDKLRLVTGTTLKPVLVGFGFVVVVGVALLVLVARELVELVAKIGPTVLKTGGNTTLLQRDSTFEVTQQESVALMLLELQ